MEREPIKTPDSFILRTHHLCILGDFLPDYLEYSKGRKPWEFGNGQFYKLVMFAKEYTIQEAGMDLTMRNYFERFVIESSTAEQDYAYVIDLIGTTKEEFDRVLKGRIDFFTGLLEIAFNGKDNKIILRSEPDDYCKACAIGKHCKDKNPEKMNMDLIYLEAFSRIANNFSGFGRTEEGELFITAELFFDTAFIRALEPLVEEIFQRESKSLDEPDG